MAAKSLLLPHHTWGHGSSPRTQSFWKGAICHFWASQSGEHWRHSPLLFLHSLEIGKGACSRIIPWLERIIHLGPGTGVESVSIFHGGVLKACNAERTLLFLRQIKPCHTSHASAIKRLFLLPDAFTAVMYCGGGYTQSHTASQME